MKKSILLILVISAFASTIYGQTKRKQQADNFLSASFKLFQSADPELADHIIPFLKERFEEALEDTTSFTNPYPQLSNHINIRYAADSLLKTYSWSERSPGCCHGSVTFAQFRTNSGQIRQVNLEVPDANGRELFITDLQRIEINKQPYYLILGAGTCCGGKHFGIARIFAIKNETLVLLDAAFDKTTELYVGANRSQKIELKYNPDTKVLSHNSYPYDEEIGFYKHEKTVVNWKLTANGFDKKN